MAAIVVDIWREYGPMSERVLHERVAALSLEQKVRLLTGADFWALHDEPAAGLRRLVTSDGPAGVRGERWDEREPSANVPSPTLLAATWDEERIERLGRLLAAEARRKGVDVVLAPMVNLHRTPYGGRHFESFSEDPLLTARIGAAYVRGLQSEGVAATVKHFVANDSETERFTLDARVDERPLRELYLAPFEAIVRETGAWTVMAAYNSVNGATMTESPAAAGGPARRVGLGRPRDVGLDGGALDRGRRQRRARPGRCPARTARGARRWWPRSGKGASPRRRSTRRCCGCCGSPAASARSRASSPSRTPRPGATRRSPASCARPPRPASCSPATTASSRSSAGAQGRAARARTRRSPRTLGGGSATVFPPYTVSPLDDLA